MPTLRIAVLPPLCVVGLAVAAGSASAATSHDPTGHLESVRVSGARVAVTGWAADGDSAVPIRVVLIRDGGADGTVLASGRRDDIGRRYPQFGPLRGFTGVLTVPAGTHRLCVTAVDVGPGTTRSLGCTTVSVAGQPVAAAPPRATRAPFGNVDRVGYSAGKLTVAGWSIDPDTAGRTLVDVTLGGTRLASVAAAAARPDVARVYPRSGPTHGFGVTVAAPAAPGNYLACVIALNTAAGPGTGLGCHTVTVAPPGPPPTLHLATATAAATALRAQAIASGVARAGEFPARASSAATIAVATRALLEQATGRRSAPRAAAGVPPFAVATPTRVVDEQAVMGRTPYLGSYPASRTGGRGGAARAPELFRNDALPAPSAAGDGLVGAAPVLAANGTTVRPRLPAYRPGAAKVRAAVALDAALSQLGVPYVYAAAGPASFDCSGLAMWAWARAGVSLYHYTGTQARQGVRVRANQLLPGDLVLFGSDLHHVGMYLGAGYMIDAPYTGAYVRVDQISSYGDFSLAVRP